MTARALNCWLGLADSRRNCAACWSAEPGKYARCAGRIRISAQPHHAYVDEQPRLGTVGAAVAGILVARPLFALRLLRLLPISAITRAVMVRAWVRCARGRVAAAYWFIRQMPGSAPQQAYPGDERQHHPSRRGFDRGKFPQRPDQRQP